MSATAGNAVHPTACIVATAARCAVGLTAETAAAAIRAGISRVTEHPHFLDSAGDGIFCGQDPLMDWSIPVPMRTAQISEGALNEILFKLSPTNGLSATVPVLLALPETRPGFGAPEALEVERYLASRTFSHARSIVLKRVGEGHAGALSALQIAVQRVLAAESGMVVVGGADSYLEPSTLQWLDADRRLARSGIRSGFNPGEGAAFFAVASVATCDRLGLEPLAQIRGLACSHEERDPKGDVGLLGEALTQAVVEASYDLVQPAELITDVYCDINGERARTDDWGFTLMRTGSRFRDGTDYKATAGQCGDIGAATAALGCVLAMEAWRMGRTDGERALVWGGSWGGARAAVVLERRVR